jgi:hypothetical protein
MIDEPKPSRGYIISVVAFMGFIGALFAVIIFSSIRYIVQSGEYGDFWGTGILFAILIGLEVFLYYVGYHDAYRIRYELTGDVLYLKCGWLLQDRISLRNIRKIEPAKRIWRVMGYGPGGSGYANRFRNGLRLKTMGGTYYISPTDPQAFRKAIEKLLPDGQLSI